MKRSTKRLVLIVHDSLMILLSLFFAKAFVAVLLETPIDYIWFSAAVLIVGYFGIAISGKVFSTITKYTDSRVLVTIAFALTVAHVILWILSDLSWGATSYRFLAVSLVLCLLLIIAPRVIWKALYDHRVRNKGRAKESSLRTLVVGAGEGGKLFIKTVQERSKDIHVVGIVDGDPDKLGTFIHGVKVCGNRNDISRLVKELEVDQITVAIPSLSPEERERILEIANETGVKINNMPSVEDIILGNVSNQTLQEINVADLLERKEVVLDQEELGSYFGDKTVLVTGAGGSIGSEICRQVASFHPKCLLLLGHGENSIYLIHKELAGKYGSQMELIPIIADIQDRARIFEVIAEYRPDVVYHAAAHKHVPLMEYNPKEAVKNNIFGTKNVAEAAKAAGVPKFVMVSTDKAVNPPNVMGATKRVAEMIVTGLNEDTQTQFVAVRFGNVLGSRGSVVPVFKEQIAQGGPVTVTDFRMTRYFMTIPEASRLVIQAGYLAKGGEIFVLDMGEPVLIKDLAKKVIKLSGYTEKEIEIVESGIRPGEKLYEELLSTDERVAQQVHKKIFVGKVTTKPLDEVETFIASLGAKNEEELRQALLAYAKQE
ncbi:polysaccharide biosynthesis protein [Streptococcus ovuberis]|uniref:Polysaccharide biosynthesis protein n=1 Tax=Streptococcus ovuberis TaxID=1936207 RepID=A0A7X6MX77_9STRE|nr:nucleoside-diphosphate sugar epimerase/dehydratase [Streptococcus ovuberis]NKZ19388.1 polysaccharide biosynthesis protein [Streptococcus ovuberis]